MSVVISRVGSERRYFFEQSASGPEPVLEWDERIIFKTLCLSNDLLNTHRSGESLLIIFECGHGVARQEVRPLLWSN